MKGTSKIVCPHCGGGITLTIETHIKPLYSRVKDKLDKVTK